MPKIPRKNLVATIKDVKADGVAGGSSTSDTYVTRDLNTLDDPDGIVTSLSSNQFTLPAGEYLIEARSPGRKTATHRIKLRNITDSTDDILGENAFNNSAQDSITHAFLKGDLNLTSQKTFEIQHYVESGLATTGLGAAIGGTEGNSEIYTTVKITLLREGI